MVVTDEPGVYIEGKFGIRIENELIVRRGEKNYMEPLIPYTDVFFNSSHEYEIAYLKKKILQMAESGGKSDQERLAEIIRPEPLRAFLGKDDFAIPEDSLFGEFYV